MENFLKKIREDRGLSVIDLSKITGIARDTIYKIENFKTGISKKNIEKLEKALNITSSQLYGGSNTAISLRYYVNAKNTDCLTKSEEYELVGVSQKLLDMFCIKDYKQTIVIKSFEKNMEPTISNNDFLIVDLSNKEILNNKIYLIDEDGKLKLKRILRKSPFSDKIIIQSDNEIEGEYPPYEIGMEQVKRFIIGQVIFYGRNII